VTLSLALTYFYTNSESLYYEALTFSIRIFPMGLLTSFIFKHPLQRVIVSCTGTVHLYPSINTTKELYQNSKQYCQVTAITFSAAVVARAVFGILTLDSNNRSKFHSNQQIFQDIPPGSN
jgi:hypothetical protein